MKRILILGSAGAGKSTLAAKMASKLGLPLIHLDQEFWLPGWVEMDKELWRRKLLRLSKKKSWVMDGHFGATQELRQKYADTVIYLDLSRWACLWGVLKRIARTYGRTRPDMAPGCREQWDWPFLVWIWNFPRHSRPAALKRLEGLKKGQRAVILRSRAEVQRYLDAL